LRANKLLPFVAVHEVLTCSWCNVIPGDPHDKDCPERKDDSPAYCWRCGVAYVTNCACSEGEDR
jgi:hypothetical protein